MLITILISIALTSLIISLIMFVTQILNSDFISQVKIDEYFLISNKTKLSRSEEEQKFIDKTWHLYYMQKLRNLSFKVGMIVLPITILLSYMKRQ